MDFMPHVQVQRQRVTSGPERDFETTCSALLGCVMPAAPVVQPHGTDMPDPVPRVGTRHVEPSACPCSQSLHFRVAVM